MYAFVVVVCRNFPWHKPWFLGFLGWTSADLNVPVYTILLGFLTQTRVARRVVNKFQLSGKEVYPWLKPWARLPFPMISQNACRSILRSCANVSWPMPIAMQESVIQRYDSYFSKKNHVSASFNFSSSLCSMTIGEAAWCTRCFPKIQRVKKGKVIFSSLFAHKFQHPQGAGNWNSDIF